MVPVVYLRSYLDREIRVTRNYHAIGKKWISNLTHQNIYEKEATMVPKNLACYQLINLLREVWATPTKSQNHKLRNLQIVTGLKR